MSTATMGIDRIELIDLRQKAHFWKAQHARAVDRETAQKLKVRELGALLRERDATIAELSRRLAGQETVCSEKDRQIEALKAKLAWLSQRVFGRKSEQTREESNESCPGVCETGGESAPPPGENKRKRGQQPGAKGHGRKRREDLETVVTPHELGESERRCPRCGKPFEDFAGTEDSEEIEWEVKLSCEIPLVYISL